MSSRNKRSEVWKHFSTVTDEKAKCSYCMKIISYTGGATGNLLRHIKTQHKTISIERVQYTAIETQLRVETTQNIDFTEIQARSTITEPQHTHQASAVPTVSSIIETTFTAINYSTYCKTN